jgi:DedD protein
MPAESAPYVEDEGEDPAPTAKVAREPAVTSSKSNPAPRKPAAAIAESQPARPKAKPTASQTRSRPEPTPSNSKKSDASVGLKPAKTATAPATNKPAPITKALETPVKKTATPAAVNSDMAPKKAATPSATKPKQSAEGKSWIVQAGTFADESNARNLVDKLKKRNLPAKVHAVEGSSGKVYRVTVGSGLDRDHAEKIQKQLSANDGINGVILHSR